MKSILFLYSEMMPYMEAVIRCLVDEHNVKVYVISWDKGKNTTHVPCFDSRVDHFDRSNVRFQTLCELIESVKPSLIYVSGRMDKLYLKIAKKYCDAFPIVSGIDTQWNGNLRSFIQVMLSSFLYRPYFSYVWVPGARQNVFVRALGYPTSRIISNLYSGDFDLFYSAPPLIDSDLKKNVLFIGRLESSKGFDNLMSSWKQFSLESRSGWRLKVIGDGSLRWRYQQTEGVDFLGFLDQKRIKKELNDVSVFILPSIYEPWGVVVHEMAAAGKMIICSQKVGSTDAFLIHGYNGLLTKSSSTKDIISILEKLFSMSEKKIARMGRNSKILSQRITPELSAVSLLSITE